VQESSRFPVGSNATAYEIWLQYLANIATATLRETFAFRTTCHAEPKVSDIRQIFLSMQSTVDASFESTNEPLSKPNHKTTQNRTRATINDQ